MDSIKYDHLLDIKGLCCSAPVLRLSKAFHEFDTGNIVLVVSDKISMTKDIPAYCNMTGQVLLQQQQQDGLFYFWIQKNKP